MGATNERVKHESGLGFRRNYTITITYFLRKVHDLEYSLGTKGIYSDMMELHNLQ